MLAPFNLQQWIDDNRDLLKPPVSNKNFPAEIMAAFVRGQSPSENLLRNIAETTHQWNFILHPCRRNTILQLQRHRRNAEEEAMIVLNTETNYELYQTPHSFL